MLTVKLDRSVTLLVRRLNTSSSGARPERWDPEAVPMWGNRRDTTGREFLASSRELSIRTCVYTLRFRADITTADRLRDEVGDWEIVSVAEINRREGLQLVCKLSAS